MLGDELGIETENTAKWLTEYRRIPELSARRERLALNLARHAYPRSPSAARLRARLAETDKAISERRLKPGQLVMIDEASLAGTFRDVYKRQVEGEPRRTALRLPVGNTSFVPVTDALGPAPRRE